MKKNTENITRRHMLRDTIWGASLAGLGVLTGHVIARAGKDDTVWQIDPAICVSCGNCATHCVLPDSAVRCVHSHPICGYCKICFGFFNSTPMDITEAAENQLCPMGAITRKFLEEPYYEYTIDESLCNGCGKCVKGCNAFGNGSLHLQVRHNLCLNCNECSIAAACPSGAFKRLPASNPYMIKKAHA